jgi:hypothetical protein
LQLLPWWDWRPLHQQRCLVSNPHFVAPPTFSSDDCVACEAVDHVDRLADTTYQHLLDAYLQRNAPVIIVDAMDDWPAIRFNFNMENITQVVNKFFINASFSFDLNFIFASQRYLLEEKLKKTRPCALTSNIRTGSNSDLVTLLTKTQNQHFSKWFLHWYAEIFLYCAILGLPGITIIFYLFPFLKSNFFVHRLNCDSTAMKALRKFYARPYFLAPSVAPAHYNWVLMSSNYKAHLFKQVRIFTNGACNITIYIFAVKIRAWLDNDASIERVD